VHLGHQFSDPVRAAVYRGLPKVFLLVSRMKNGFVFHDIKYLPS